MTWGDVGQGGSGSEFLKVEAGKKVRVHVLTEDPHSYKHVFFDDLNRGAVVDDGTVDLIQDKKRVRAQHAFWVVTEEGEAKIWQMGNRLAGQVREIHDNYGSFAEVDLMIARTGTKKETTYVCTPVPVKIDYSVIDVSTLTPLEEALAASSREDVESLVAGIDPSTEFDTSKLEKESQAAGSSVIEPEPDEAPPPVRATQPKSATPGVAPDRSVIVREIMTLLAKSKKYGTALARAGLFKRVTNRVTLASMSVPELGKIRSELKKA